MAKKMLIIEVDELLVKVCVADGTVEKRKPEKFFMFELPTGVIQDGIIVDSDTFSEMLQEKLDENGCKKIKDVLFTVISNRVATREVKLPYLSDSKIGDLVKNNAKEYFPLDLSKYKLKFRVMSRQKKGDDKHCTVLVIAMPITLVKSYENVVTAGKFKLLGVDASSNSLVDGCVLLSQSEVTVFVNVNCSGTYLSFMQGKDLLLHRVLSFGGDEFLKSYIEMSEGNVTYTEAIEQLSGADAEMYIDGKLDEEELATSYSRIIGGISRSIDYFNTNKQGNIGRVIFMGSCGKLARLQELVEDATGLTVEDVTMLSAAIQYKSKNPNFGFYICCMGAGVSKINFSDYSGGKKGGKKQKESSGGVDPSVYLALSVLFFIGAGYWGYDIYSKHSAAELELATTKSQVTTLLHLDGIYQNYISYDESLASLLDFNRSTENYNEQLLAFISDFESKMPTEILVLSATCGPTAVNFNVEVGSFTAAASVISKLRTFESIKDIQVSTIEISENELGEEYASFAVMCQYGENPYVAGLNPYQADLDSIAPTA